MASIRISFALLIVCFSIACSQPATPVNNPVNTAPTAAPTPEIADHFAYPIGKDETVTAKKDGDEWFNEVDFGQKENLGEVWTVNKGGNEGCGEPVYAIANGVITFADFAGPEWGLVIIVDHQLPSGEKVQSLYGNLFDMSVKAGPVKKRQQIGRIGNANGRYLCRLYFEMRTSDAPLWGQPGPIFGKEPKGWVDPSNFIDTHR
ncbi:hypothetical protein BH10ACI3_BH10ACI3_07780 [soil metagenome]